MKEVVNTFCSNDGKDSYQNEPKESWITLFKHKTKSHLGIEEEPIELV